MSSRARYVVCGLAGVVLVVALVVGLLHYGAVALGYEAAAVAVGVPLGLWMRRNT